MNLNPPRLRRPFRHGARRAGALDDALDAGPGGSGTGAAPLPVREPEDDVRSGEVTEPGWRGSSYDLKHGLDVVELPTTLPVDVLDRLFNAPAK